ncbi:MAG: hypothetical protein KatS3mg017_0651 [Fimbriimonadales bacterium]|nr:MAG: hypothetical protein KatS3mg017_0651 [Fimbriimonadales bacterium]
MDRCNRLITLLSRTSEVPCPESCKILTVMPQTLVLEGDCLKRMAELEGQSHRFALTFLDPPFNQGKDYASFHDNLPEEMYWDWVTEGCRAAHRLSLDGGAVYFMQRKKNTEAVLRVLREASWTLRSEQIWLAQEQTMLYGAGISYTHAYTYYSSGEVETSTITFSTTH